MDEEPHAPITPNFPFGFNCEIVGDYVQIWMLAHHFLHYYSRRCQRMVSQLAGVMSPSVVHMLLPTFEGRLHSKSKKLKIKGSMTIYVCGCVGCMFKGSLRRVSGKNRGTLSMTIYIYILVHVWNA
jgi:hypothetical protein